MKDYDRRNYTPRTLCEVCAKACGGCSWSRKDVQLPVEGWDAVRHDFAYTDRTYTDDVRAFYNESYIVLHCPEFELEPHNAWAFEKFEPEKYRVTLSARNRGWTFDKITGKRVSNIDERTPETIPND